MDEFNKSLERLQCHAGLPMQGLEIPKDTLAEFVFQVQRDGDTPDLADITEDIIQRLDDINQSLRRQVAGEHQQQCNCLDRRVIYAVSGIVCACLGAIIEMRQADPTSQIVEELLVTA